MTIHTHGYATHSATSELVPFTFERRDPRPTDVVIDILYCGICHSDIHTARNEWGWTQLYEASPKDQMHIQHFLSANCFGDHYTRGGVDAPTRELLTFSMLVALGGCEPQVKGHVAANLKVGNDRAKLVDVLTQLLPVIGYPRTLNGLRMVNEGTAP
jgi:alkylhydroperoxidase/carboxymuconolactone decarboxylase family protein YurZ